MLHEFIKDVIYNLKMEYGESCDFIIKGEEAFNVLSGLKTADVFNLYVDKIIALPLDRRAAFLKSVGIHSSAYVEVGTQQFLLDADDVIGHEPKINDKLTIAGKNQDIKLVEKFPSAYILTTSTPY